MKKSCNGCRAYGDGRCDLHFQIESKKYFNFIPIEFKPKEECPKPKTYDQYIYLQELKQEKGLTNEEIARWKFI